MLALMSLPSAHEFFESLDIPERESLYEASRMGHLDAALVEMIEAKGHPIQPWGFAPGTEEKRAPAEYMSYIAKRMSGTLS
jgi:hypothetical protein